MVQWVFPFKRSTSRCQCEIRELSIESLPRILDVRGLSDAQHLIIGDRAGKPVLGPIFHGQTQGDLGSPMPTRGK